MTSASSALRGEVVRHEATGELLEVRLERERPRLTQALESEPKQGDLMGRLMVKLLVDAATHAPA